ncbi:NfeD family protein [Chitinivibrio alkaliphilus]|uniref:Serine protease, ClpP class n=1 Tax=Chitinivibrio alkaliphilus ACht1 TaxID=1313304 RepID=U7D654_9BACT|nr:NfeD family protein [Chitinivibrio alkaliphilus]ERP31056.1 serine protease, ClpP class [Chitinivibrio alkaliphilus ACht1]
MICGKVLLILVAAAWGVVAHVHHVTLTGMVDHSMEHLVTRALSQVEPEDTLLLTVDSDGGRIDAALSIADALHTAPAYTLAYVQHRALSAAALISLACDSFAMTDGSTIGDSAPVMMSQEGPQTLGEKIQSPLRAKMRAYAEHSGYPPLLAEAMVTENLRVYHLSYNDTHTFLSGAQYDRLDREEQNRAELIVDETQLLTLTDREAYSFGFSLGSYASFSEFLSRRDIHVSGEEFTPSWSERLASRIAAFAPVLMALAMAALFIESRSPGIGIPGAVGAVLLLIVFSAQSLVGLAAHTELLIVVIGLTLLFVEAFILPGFGIAGILGLMSIAFAGVLSLQNFIIPDPELPWQEEIFLYNLSRMSYAFLVSLILVILFFKFVFPHVRRISSGIILESVMEGRNSDDTYATTLQSLVGKTGQVEQALRPTGTVRCGREIYDATSRGRYLDAGETVQIEGYSGRYLTVSPHVEDE